MIHLVLAIWAALHLSTPDARDLAAAVAGEARDPFEAALVAYYIAKESGVRIHPNAYSPDALAQVSCGPLQMPCSYVSTHSTRQQVRWWLAVVRAGGLVSLDSSAPRAYRRFGRAMALLATVR